MVNQGHKKSLALHHHQHVAKKPMDHGSWEPLGNCGTQAAPLKAQAARLATASQVDCSVQTECAPDDKDVEEEGLDDGAWHRRAQARLRQIHIGKAWPEYRRYIQEIPVESRGKSQPSTPDPYERVSKRQFDRALGAWRRQLHDFDVPGQWPGAATLARALDVLGEKENVANASMKKEATEAAQLPPPSEKGKRKAFNSRALKTGLSMAEGPSSSSGGSAEALSNQPRIPSSLADGLGTGARAPPPRHRENQQ